MVGDQAVAGTQALLVPWLWLETRLWLKAVIDTCLLGLTLSHLILMQMVMGNNLRDVAFQVLYG